MCPDRRDGLLLHELLFDELEERVGADSRVRLVVLQLRDVLLDGVRVVVLAAELVKLSSRLRLQLLRRLAVVRA